jgi:phage N-6-adenine-methyltransferase
MNDIVIPVIRIDKRLRSHIPPLRADERAQLEENLLRDGCQSPLIVWDGVLLDGHNRYEICQRHGLPFETIDIDLPDFEDAVEWIEENQLGRRNLNDEQRAYYIGRKYERTKKADAGRADRDLSGGQNVRPKTAELIASEHGIEERTVRRHADYARDVDAVAEALGDGVRTELLSGKDGLTRQDVSEIAEVSRELLVQKFTGNPEWYTPADILASARLVLGDFDLDPASCDEAQQTVKAGRYFTLETDGLEQNWSGRVWLNPPYTDGVIGKFVTKLVSHVRSGEVSAAILLVDNKTDTRWFHEASDACSSICFTKGRIKFLRPGGEPGSPTNGSAFFYFGDDPDTFERVFGDIGKVTRLSGKDTRQDSTDIATAAKEAPVTGLSFASPREALDWIKQYKTEKAAQQREANAKLKADTPTVIPEGKYGTIVIDPPWNMKKSDRDVAPNQVAFDYPTMTEEELAAFPVPDMAADDSHLFCWTTQTFLPVSLRLIESWGFRYVLQMVWHKNGGFQPFGLPQYNCEFVIYARRGTPSFIDTKAFPCCFHGDGECQASCRSHFVTTVVYPAPPD